LRLSIPILIKRGQDKAIPARSLFGWIPPEECGLNKDVFEGKWKEMRGQVKEWWGELTDDDLDGWVAKPISSSV